MAKNAHKAVRYVKRSIARFRPTKFEGRTPRVDAIRPFFDTDFYLLNNLDVRQAGMDPVLHYWRHGWREGRNPTSEFSVREYLENNPALAQADVDPFWHYIEFEVTRRGGDLRKLVGADTGAQVAKEAELIHDFFDASYYLSRNPDVEEQKLDPIKHYCTVGWREHRNPNAWFSTRYYLEANPDVAEAGINPFWHYIIIGKSEKRTPRHPGAHKAEHLRVMLPLERQVGRWLRKDVAEPLLSSEDIAKALKAPLSKGAGEMILSISHDHYRNVSGGVQLCIQREEAEAQARGIVYLNIHPWQPLPRLVNIAADEDPLQVLILDGKEIGVCRFSALTKTVQKCTGNKVPVRTVVHHMLGHSPERIVELVRATKTSVCWMWQHDFFTVCPSYTLHRNGVTFCNAPDVDSNACSICLFGEERRSHVKRMAALFDALDVHLLSPSQVAADLWQDVSGLVAAKKDVIPHSTLKKIRKTAKIKKASESDQISIGFIGIPTLNKGWPAFEKVHSELYRTGRFRFVYFGVNAIDLKGVETVDVHVTVDQPNAMIDAIAAQKIDYVLHWSTCFETYSFSVHEAICGGAHVLTNEISGNVASVVKSLDRGEVFADEDVLLAFLVDGDAEKLLQRHTKKSGPERYNQELSTMTFAAWDKEQAR